ncbi:RNA methyltransferase [Candidatus Binatia bacterium]|nr:RNA methyltransferase [Candidatus Binatia bacterium]
MLGNVRIVLVRPRRGGNVGAAARVMKNFGLGELTLVAPRTRVGAVGERMAAHARDVLARRTSAPDLAAAVADCALVVGTAGRDFAHLRALPPRDVAAEIVAAGTGGRVALVFGPEDHGLSNADLGRCQRLLRIPTGDAYPSLNLAQAVAVCAYELRLAAADAGAGVDASTSPRRRRPPGGSAAARTDDRAAASSAEREALLEHLGQALDAIGFLSRQNPAHIVADLRGLFARAGLTRRDVKIWRGIARQMLWAARAR